MTHVKTGRLGGTDHQQTVVEAYKTGRQFCLLPTCIIELNIADRRCIRHRMKGRQNDGSMGTSGIGKGDVGERTHSSDERKPCACLAATGGGS